MSSDQDRAFVASLVFGLLAAGFFGLAAESWLITAGVWFAWASLHALAALHAHSVFR